MRKITYYLALALSAIAISCNNDEPPLLAGGPEGFYDNIRSGGWPVTEIPSEGYEITLHNGD